MAQLSRTHALPKDPDSVPSTQVVALIHSSSSRERDTLFWPSWALHALGGHTHIESKHLHK